MFALLKARTALLISAALVVAGSVPVLYLAALLCWQFATLFETKSWVPLPAALLFTDHALLQGGKAAPVLAFIPELHWAWASDKVAAWILGRVHVGLVPALAGLAVTALAATRVFRENDVIRVQQQWHEDRLRRVGDYRREASEPESFDGRREPFIGSLSPIAAQREHSGVQVFWAGQSRGDRVADG